MTADTHLQLRVLLVEDDEDDYFLTCALLRRIDDLTCDVQWARNFEKALQILTMQAIDVCLIDFNLGRRTGLELLETLKGVAFRGGRPAFVMLTGQADHDSDIETMRAGADDYLVKSQLDAESLEHALRYAVARRHKDEVLRRSEERFRLAARAGGELIWEWNHADNTLWLSDEFAAAFGAISSDFAGFAGRIHADDRERVIAHWRAVLESNAPVWSSEFRLRRTDETYAVVLARGCIVRDSDGTALRVVGALSDISERKAWEDQLLHRAFHDPLTNLPNRALFLDRLEHALARTQRSADSRFAVVFLDLDGFKQVNHEYGHLTGDALLCDVAARLQRAVRPEDTVARLGGDEFVALLDNIEQQSEALPIARRIHNALAVPLQVGTPPGETHQIQIGASIGIALGSPHYVRPDDILRDADIAMYRAKAAMHQNGASHIVFHMAQPATA